MKDKSTWASLGATKLLVCRITAIAQWAIAVMTIAAVVHSYHVSHLNRSTAEISI